MIDILPLDVDESEGAVLSVHIGMDIETLCFFANYLNRAHFENYRKYDTSSKRLAKQLSRQINEFLKERNIVTIDDKLGEA